TSNPSVNLTTRILYSSEYSTTRSALTIFAILHLPDIWLGVYFIGGALERPKGVIFSALL
ncbi:hypothetical protein, partial [Alteromonas australica]|uniref:hypothetical protein n=1 Tax=Alteromonas australica TaxID=589873 RepID=UPI003F67CA12